jgi:hypothetical protein
VISENEDDLPGFAGRKIKVHLVSADWLPAVGDGVAKLASFKNPLDNGF